MPKQKNTLGSVESSEIGNRHKVGFGLIYGVCCLKKKNKSTFKSSENMVVNTAILCLTRLTEKEVGRQHQGMDRPGVRQVPEGSGEQRKMEETGCEIA